MPLWILNVNREVKCVREYENVFQTEKAITLISTYIQNQVEFSRLTISNLSAITFCSFFIIYSSFTSFINMRNANSPVNSTYSSDLV